MYYLQERIRSEKPNYILFNRILIIFAINEQVRKITEGF